MPKIGLEIHGYLNTREKLFCSCKVEHGAKHASPNINICPICTGMPGAKPLLPNKNAIDKAIQIALILKCNINEKLVWQRKHYDWPDLPKGFQNTISGSHASPLGINGNFFGVKITECHIEEDPAAWNPSTGEIDYNRSGSPLIEIVTAPDFTDAEQVVEWLKKLTISLSYIKTIDKNSGLKADVNISLPEKKGARVEIKNINSIRNIKTAFLYEIKRQSKELPRTQETRMFDEKKGVTKLMRAKEESEDYRFISEPDLPVVHIEKQRIEKIKSSLPETPAEKLEKLVKKHKISKKSAEVLTKKLEVVEFFEKILESKINPSLVVKWVTEELLSVLNYNKKELENIQIIPNHFVELLELIEGKKITELKAKDILRSWIPKSFSPKRHAEKHKQISDEKEIQRLVKKVINENKKAVEDFKAGKKESLNFLIGEVMKLSDKRADYEITREVLERMLRG